MKKNNKSLNSIIIKHRIKNTIYDLFCLLVVLIVAFISNKLIEFLTFLLSYTLIRNEFIKAIHGSDLVKSAHKGIILCRIITTIVQLISLIFLVKVDISKYANIGLAITLGVINFLAKDYLEHKVKKIKFYKGMSAEDMPKDLVGIEYKIIYLYYVKRYKLDKIAYDLQYSYDNVYKIKAKIVKRYSQ